MSTKIASKPRKVVIFDTIRKAWSFTNKLRGKAVSFRIKILKHKRKPSTYAVELYATEEYIVDDWDEDEEDEDEE